MMRRALVLCGLALALSACGSPADHLSFKPPAGFTNPKNILGMAQIWTNADGREALMLMKMPVKTDPAHAVSSAGVKNATVTSQQQIRICGHQLAQRIVMQGTGKDRTTMDAVMSTNAAGSYMAMYSRPAGTPPNRDAENAIRSLCAV